MTDTFSPADARVIARPAGNDAILELARRVGMLTRQLDTYVSNRSMPGGVYDTWINPASQAGVSGTADASVIHEHDLGFPAHSVAIDNVTSQWLWAEPCNREVPPYSIGWIFPCVGAGSQSARVSVRTPPGTQAFTPVSGERCYVAWHEAFLPPMAGVPVPAQLIANTGAGATPLFPGATQITGQGGPVSNATATATLVGTAGVLTWVTGFSIEGDGSTAGGTVLATITGLLGGTLTYAISVPASATGTVFEAQFFNPPLRSSATGVSIVLSVPAFGAGNVNVTAHLYGFTL